MFTYFAVIATYVYSLAHKESSATRKFHVGTLYIAPVGRQLVVDIFTSCMIHCFACDLSLCSYRLFLRPRTLYPAHKTVSRC